MNLPPSIQTSTDFKGIRQRFHAMVKPAGSLCNLDCAYCYYLHKGGLLGHEPHPKMADDVLEDHIKQYIESQTGERVVFSWQGGEPTLSGIDFFQRVVDLQALYRKPGQAIDNDLQTNGTLLNDEWVSFLKRHKFLVGLSIDGPQSLHDRYRLTKGGEPTHKKVMSAARMLRLANVPFNVLCVVNRDNAREPNDVYRFLTRDVGVRRLQFIPCVESKTFMQCAPQYGKKTMSPTMDADAARPGAPDSFVTDWTVDPEDWGRFLCGVWNFWYKRDFGKVHVDLFETAIAQSLGMPAQRCVNAEFCGKALAIEHNGDVFSCDHYVYPEYRLGNIREMRWGQMAFGEKQRKFGFAKRDALPAYCRSCRHLSLCWGECPKNRLLKSPDGEPGLNYLCRGFKMFYTHIEKDMPEIFRRIGRVHENMNEVVTS